MNKINNFEDYLNQYEQSKTNNGQYWSSVAENLNWMKKWDQVSSGDFSHQNVEWFKGAKTNLSMNCLDRHLETKGTRTL